MTQVNETTGYGVKNLQRKLGWVLVNAQFVLAFGRVVIDSDHDRLRRSVVGRVGCTNGEAVSSRLRPLLEAVYKQVLAEPIESATLKQSLVALLTFLGGEGLSNANCWAADLFFARGENWETDWAERNLPESIHDVMAMMSDALHDTVQAPEIARNFGCLPEQLLERVEQAL